MKLVLTPDLFTLNKYSVIYGDREALFTIIDEEFPGNNRLGRINRITILVRHLDSKGRPLGAKFCTTVIGFGDGVVGVQSEHPGLRGKLLTRDNMEQCTVVLYED